MAALRKAEMSVSTFSKETTTFLPSRRSGAILSWTACPSSAETQSGPPTMSNTRTIISLTIDITNQTSKNVVGRDFRRQPVGVHIARVNLQVNRSAVKIALELGESLLA